MPFGRRGRARRQNRRANRRSRRMARRGFGGRSAPAAPAPAATPEPTVAPSELVANMTASGPAEAAPAPSPAAAAPQTLPVQAARGLVGDDALNAAATAGDTAVETGQNLQQAGQERQADYGEGGQLELKGQPQKEFGTGEGQTLNPMDAPGRYLGDQVIGGINKAQQLYGQGQEMVGDVVEGAGNLYNKAIDAGGRAYNTLAETVQAGKDAVVDAGRATGEVVGEAIKPVTDAGAAAGKAVGDAMYAGQNEQLAQPISDAEVQDRIAKTEAQEKKRQLPTPVRSSKPAQGSRGSWR